MAADQIVPRPQGVPSRTLDAALFYARQGLPVFVLSRSKVPYKGTHGHLDATTDETTIQAWFADPARKQPSIGIPMGAVSRLVTIEDDPRNGGVSSLELLEATYGPLPPTYTVRSGSGGYHRRFRHPGVYIKSGANRFGADFPGVDVKGDGGYVVVPPSVHKNGKRYEVVDDLPVAELPDAWLAALVETQPPAPELPPDAFDGTDDYAGDGRKWLDWALNLKRDGSSDFYGYQLAIQLLANRCQDVATWLQEYADAATYDVSWPFGDRDIVRWHRSAEHSRIVQRGEPARSTKRPRLKVLPKPAPAGTQGEEAPADADDLAADLLKGEADDTGNAEAMNRLYGRDFLYTPAYGWLQWTGTHWHPVPEPIVQQNAITTLRARRHAAVDAEAEAIVKATKGDRNRVQGCLALFKSYVIEPAVGAFDNDPDVLNCQNGVLNLRTGTLAPHDPRQRFTYCLPVAWDPEADMSEWQTFLLDALGRNKEQIDYLQVCAGYSLTGHTREEKLFYLYGPTRAGKGTFTETMLALLPHPLGTGVDFATFTARRENDSQNFDLAELKPARLVVASESNRHQALNPAKIKQLTGGDMVRCAFKHRDMFSYRPQFKVWLVSNHELSADADDDAAWGRAQVFTFPHSHLGNEDVTLKARMRSPENLRGVLRWAVEGARTWYTLDRLVEPSSVRAATSAQRDAQDYIKQWLDDCCTLAPRAWAASSSLYQSYTTWCELNGTKPRSTSDFGETLVKRFACQPARHHGGTRGYDGIMLGSPVAPDPDPDPDPSGDTGDTGDTRLDKVDRVRGENAEKVDLSVTASPVSPSTKRTDCERVGHVWVLNDKHGLEICYCGAARVPGTTA